MGRKKNFGGAPPPFGEGQRGPHLTQCGQGMPSFILIRKTVWPQCTNVTDRQTGQTDRQTTVYSIGRTVLQTVAQRRSESAAEERVICFRGHYLLFIRKSELS